MKNFEQLSEQQQNVMYDALPLITILIAGADDDIELDETHWAKRVIHFREFTTAEILQDFYKELAENRFEARLRDLIEMLPENTPIRQGIISSQLEKLNPVLADLNPEFSVPYYQSLLSFAKQVARADGGVLGFFSVSKEEEQYLDLPMIQPI
ncbi:MAG: hypothetical protein IPL35_01045 [Sphingobacteriales bacterium]|nr:hypothetical protein [Sphingobacteriales bacterium]